VVSPVPCRVAPRAAGAGQIAIVVGVVFAPAALVPTDDHEGLPVEGDTHRLQSESIGAELRGNEVTDSTFSPGDHQKPIVVMPDFVAD